MTTHNGTPQDPHRTDETAVEEIRRAAALIRERETEPWRLAVADWLDNEALTIEDLMSGTENYAVVGPGYEVARAYLG
jgi:thymidylate synthase ThyX